MRPNGQCYGLTRFLFGVSSRRRIRKEQVEPAAGGARAVRPRNWAARQCGIPAMVISAARTFSCFSV